MCPLPSHIRSLPTTTNHPPSDAQSNIVGSATVPPTTACPRPQGPVIAWHSRTNPRLFHRPHRPASSQTVAVGSSVQHWSGAAFVDTHTPVTEKFAAWPTCNCPKSPSGRKTRAGRTGWEHPVFSDVLGTKTPDAPTQSILSQKTTVAHQLTM